MRVRVARLMGFIDQQIPKRCRALRTDTLEERCALSAEVPRKFPELFGTVHLIERLRRTVMRAGASLDP